MKIEYRVKTCSHCKKEFRVEVQRGRSTDYCPDKDCWLQARRKRQAGYMRKRRAAEEARKSGYRIPA